ncbi:uncharacterized protein LOC135480248 [Liolophura sinensis]|uniref:uncharacterized protein LOC135480248 n=1 Tax=Liolophura sinensis TaxID=3198878 RepID=UPI00315848F9
MPSKTRLKQDSDQSPDQAHRSPQQTQRSPNLQRLYPSLPLEDSDDENDKSWAMSSPGDLTQSSFTSSDQYQSSYLEDSPSGLGRQPLHSSDRMPRLRSGRSYGAESFSENSDSHESPRRYRPAQAKDRAAKLENSNNSTWSLIVLGVTVVVVIVGIYWCLPINKTPHVSQLKLYEQFKTRMSDLRGKFPAQSARSWKVLHVATKHIVENPQPVYPAVVLMVGVENTLPTMSCIGSQMVSMLNQLYNVSRDVNGETKILAMELNQNTPAQEKKDLDKKLRKAFSSGNKGAMLVNVERLSPEAALMLHSYCDNDNAPFTNVLLMLQLVTDKLQTEDLGKQQAVEGFMMALWEKQLGVDRIMALFSRIANNIIPISPEETETLRAACASSGWF